MYDVIVVGGGPTGFVTALGLAQAGVKVCVIEAENRIIDSPRAAVYHFTVLPGLERLGIREAAEQAGFTKRDYRWLVKKTGEVIDYSLDALEGRAPFPYNIHLGQDLLAGIARDRLLALSNAEVRFSSRLVGVDQDADGVNLLVEGPGGVESMRAKWVIGADGAGSTMRKLLGLAFDGMTWPERFVATNVYHDFEGEGHLQTTLVVDDKWGAVIAKITTDGMWRCTFMEDAALPEDSFMERIPEAYDHLLGNQGEYRLAAAAPYRMHQRCVESLRAGRVLLAGDAAHVTNPTGGLGLTCGLYDAYALWPTLAAVVLEGADAALLDVWAGDRRRVFTDIASPRAVANKYLVFHANGGGAALEEALDRLRSMEHDAEARVAGAYFVAELETVSPVEAG